MHEQRNGIVANVRSLARNRGLNINTRGLYDINDKKTRLQIFKRDDLYEDVEIKSLGGNKAKNDKDNEKETDVSIDKTEENQEEYSSSSRSILDKTEMDNIINDLRYYFPQDESLITELKNKHFKIKSSDENNPFYNKYHIRQYIQDRLKNATTKKELQDYLATGPGSMFISRNKLEKIFDETAKSGGDIYHELKAAISEDLIKRVDKLDKEKSADLNNYRHKLKLFNDYIL